MNTRPLISEQEFEKKLDSLPPWKQVMYLTPVAFVTLYILAGILRALSVITHMHPPIPMPFLDWWWMWLVK